MQNGYTQHRSSYDVLGQHAARYQPGPSSQSQKADKAGSVSMKSLLSGYGQGIMQQSPQCASYERIERDHQDLRQKNQSQVYGGYGDKSQFRSNYEQFY